MRYPIPQIEGQMDMTGTRGILALHRMTEDPDLVGCAVHSFYIHSGLPEVKSFTEAARAILFSLILKQATGAAGRGKAPCCFERTENLTSLRLPFLLSRKYWLLARHVFANASGA